MIRFLALLATLLSPTLAAGETLYVALDGRDTNDGSVDSPVATLTRARDMLRERIAAGALMEPTTVIIAGGTYRLEEPFRLTPADSGTSHAPITYAARDGETVIVSAGKPITGWKRDGELWTVSIEPELSRRPKINSLWVNGTYRRPARSPNDGYFATAGRADGWKNPETDEFTELAYTAFKFNEDDIEFWSNPEDAVVVAFHSWDTTHFQIERIDEETDTFYFTGRAYWEFERWGEKQRYYVEHFREGLDAPGEWYFDPREKTLSYYPMPGESIDDTEVIVPLMDQVLVLAGELEKGEYVEHVHFRGISFRHADHVLGEAGLSNEQAAHSVQGAIQADGARFCSFAECEVTQSGTYGIWLRRDCENIRVERCHVHHLGAGGVRIGDTSNSATQRVVVHNNRIHDGGLMYPAGVGVWIGRSSYNVVSNNEISDFYYTGISVGWSWGYADSTAHNNVIQYNRVHDLGKGVLSDMGGVYLLGVAPGTIVRNNVFHDIESYAYGGWGIYPDEGSSFLTITDNVVYNTKTGGFHQHYGRENTVRNNIFAFSKNDQLQRTRMEDHLSFTFEQNIVYFREGALLGSNWSDDQYKMDRNLYWREGSEPITFKGSAFAEWQARGQDTNSIIADPLFVDPSNYNFRLDPASPALRAIGFQPINTENVGLIGWDTSSR